MTVVFRTSQFIAKECGRGCRWATIGAADLTVARVVRIPEPGTVIDRIHDQSAAGCHVVLAGIPPMGDFRPMPPWVRKLLMLQIRCLNGITLAAASHIPDTSFAPLPDWRVGNMFVAELVSWKALHEMWTHVLASATMKELDEASKTETTSDPD